MEYAKVVREHALFFKSGEVDSEDDVCRVSGEVIDFEFKLVGFIVRCRPDGGGLEGNCCFFNVSVFQDDSRNDWRGLEDKGDVFNRNLRDDFRNNLGDGFQNGLRDICSVYRLSDNGCGLCRFFRSGRGFRFDG